MGVRCAVEHVHHRHNASAILRTCDALGIHTVHVVGDERFRASQGPARGAERWLDLRAHRSTEEAVAALRAEGVALWVADLDPEARAPEAIPLDRPVCIWLGAEVLGVDPVARAAADGVVSLPMHGFAQSLNVSVAAAMILRTVAERSRSGGPAACFTPEAAARLVARWRAVDEAAEGAAAAAAARSEALADVLDQGD